ncbi:hypothetical protein KI387_034290 [Taxus chinensis]|uniref:Cytochrome P450 n=1 Tax=Taxus chinensis TaxID=29808 RepID=A0AA38C0G0_TAXCH|nr:hypothetical protein KI387_034290 [Taxus chinensis]
MLAWAPYGAYWRNVRKICVVELLSSKRIQSFQPKRTRLIAKAISSLFEQGLLHHKIINMNEFFFRLSFDLLMGMIIGDKYFTEKSVVSYDEVKHAMEESVVLHGAISIGDYIPWLKPFDLQGYEKAMKKVQRKLDSYLQRIVEKHRENESNKEEDEIDFIDVLISQEKNEAICDKDAFVKATAMQMIVAGVETSVVALEWALSLLLCYPRTLKKAHEELDSKVGRNRLVLESDIEHLKYLQAIVKETLRLYPPAPLLQPHQSIEACTVGSFQIPAGTTLMINAWAIQRDEKVWKNPLEFIPERFLDEGGEREIDNIYNKENDFGMVLFGAGRRGCPGSSLAMSTLNITLSKLLQGFEFFIPNGQVIDMSEGIGVTMPRVVPLQVVIQPRLPQSLY